MPAANQEIKQKSIPEIIKNIENIEYIINVLLVLGINIPMKNIEQRNGSGNSG